MTEKTGEGQLLRLSQLAASVGVTRQTIEYYVMIGLLTETTRTKGGHMLFDRKTIQRVKLILKLNRSGYPLREIKETFLKPRHAV